MMSKFGGVGIALALAVAGGSAQAADPIAFSRSAILSGNLASAEQTLDAERRIYPERQEVLLNLAAVYANSGRPQAAAALYQHVLARRDVMMDVDGERTRSAHAIARSGLARTASFQTASR
ncbi:tetratricopeptide repeat protein [Sphingomonas sp. RS2018]